MKLQDIKETINDITTPAYIFDFDAFKKKVIYTADMLGNIPLTYSIKANPYLMKKLPEQIKHVEVCSPGELEICKKYNIPGSRIIYSGVNKQESDITEALMHEVDIATAESMLHIQTEQKAASKLGKVQKVILRLSSGNQFGMSEKDIFDILEHSDKYKNINFYGIHYYSGTQKKERQIKKDIERLLGFLTRAKEQFGFEPHLVEYGPGFCSEYFSEPYDETEKEAFGQALPLLKDFAKKYPLGIEMGRFLASPCGTYITTVSDMKVVDETNFVITDGGIHHLRYYGQTLAMQEPEIEVAVNKDEFDNYCLCGSLCTVADVLVRQTSLPKLNIGDKILFHRCGAYSVTEANVLFLSRKMPDMYAYTLRDGVVKLKTGKESWTINISND